MIMPTPFGAMRLLSRYGAYDLNNFLIVVRRT